MLREAEATTTINCPRPPFTCQMIPQLRPLAKFAGMADANEEAR
eukprot:gene26374-biopygen16168